MRLLRWAFGPNSGSLFAGRTKPSCAPVTIMLRKFSREETTRASAHRGQTDVSEYVAARAHCRSATAPKLHSTDSKVGPPNVVSARRRGRPDIA